MNTSRYILEDRKPVLCEDLMTWSNWFEIADRHVAKTDIGIPTWKFWLGKLIKRKKLEPVRVSTVFLGLNHSFKEDEPLLFETLIFGGKYDGELERYATWEQAEKGHKEWVEKIKKGKI